MALKDELPKVKKFNCTLESGHPKQNISPGSHKNPPSNYSMLVCGNQVILKNPWIKLSKRTSSTV